MEYVEKLELEQSITLEVHLPNHEWLGLSQTQLFQLLSFKEQFS